MESICELSAPEVILEIVLLGAHPFGVFEGISVKRVEADVFPEVTDFILSVRVVDVHTEGPTEHATVVVVLVSGVVEFEPSCNV